MKKILVIIHKTGFFNPRRWSSKMLSRIPRHWRGTSGGRYPASGGKSSKLALRFMPVIYLICLFATDLRGQGRNQFVWAADGNRIYQFIGGSLVAADLPRNRSYLIADSVQLTPPGEKQALKPASFQFSKDTTKVLLFTNTARVWRYRTRGDYWVFDRNLKQLKQLGVSLPSQSLQFAKFSPGGQQVAYVSGHNIYVEDLATGAMKQLTSDGTRKLINGTFDWVYEEEFFCRDGFRWSPDGKRIAFWQVDAADTRDYIMINNTDSVYPRVVPVEYPVAGETPSLVRVGVIDVDKPSLVWMKVPGDPRQHYIPRMEWAPDGNEIIFQQLNRYQNESILYRCSPTDGTSIPILTEKDEAWIDIIALWDKEYAMGGWDWLSGGKDFLWPSEKDGWRHLYRISRDGKAEQLLTPGDFDVIDLCQLDEKGGYVYYLASPENATQKYLYRSRLDGKGKPERITPLNQPGTHTYRISPNGRFAFHGFNNYYTPPADEWITLPDHKTLQGKPGVKEALAGSDPKSVPVEFFKIKTGEGVEMDAWMVKPRPFDPAKRYPVVFYVYTEPWGQNVTDEYGVADNFLYSGDMAGDGYFYISIDNRGTPVPKGREWRKSIYRKIGRLNIHDQALAAREVLKWPYIDTSRVAVWGWSGGGTATLNLMFQYPELYKTGIAVAAVVSQFTYDNIYQERYMGLPQENRKDFIEGSPLHYVSRLKGNLLYIHGTGDDNVHYQNAELLLNECIKYNKQIQFMAYPNRTHGISEGEGTFEHLQTLYTNYLREKCPPGPR